MTFKNIRDFNKMRVRIKESDIKQETNFTKKQLKLQ